MADKAHAGFCRAGYTRAGVYIPIFENTVLPTLQNAKPPNFNDLKTVLANAKPPSFADLKKVLENYG